MIPRPMKTFLPLMALFLTQSLYAQPKNLHFDNVSFSDKLAVAEWMVEYDSVAWRMSELVTRATWDELARMGREWFCYKGDDSIWHGIYGKYKDGKYDLVIHYILGANDTIDVSCTSPDTARLSAISRAIRTAYREATPILGGSSAKMNKFVRVNDNRSISVWLMPALQSLDVALYGGEFFYRFNTTGDLLLERSEYYQGNFKGLRLGKLREVQLNYEDTETPTLGAVYFALKYRSRFSGIRINTRAGTSLFAFSQVKGYYWLHADKLKANP